MFHRQNSKTNLPRYSRHDELKNPPNLSLTMLFCTSRGLKWLKRLKIPTPTRACRCLSRNGSEIGRVIWTSKEEKRGKRIDVTRTDVCTELILDGVRKSRVQFIYGDDG